MPLFQKNNKRSKLHSLLHRCRIQNFWSKCTLNRTFNSAILYICIAIIFCFLAIFKAHAHAPGQSYLYFQVYDQKVTTRVEITVDDLNQALDLDLPTNRQAKAEEIEPHLQQIQDYINQNLIISHNQQQYPLEYQGYHHFKTGFARFLTFDYQIGNLPEIPSQLDVYYGVLLDIEPKHKNLVVIEHNWDGGIFANESSVSLVFSANSPPQTLDLSSASFFKGFLAVIKIGFLQIFEGTDHILFLIALILPSVLPRENLGGKPVQSFRLAGFYVIKIAIVFGVAHSITLALATLQIVELSTRIVQSIIALSIAIAAVNIIYPLFGSRIWLIIFAFGLFHGFAFAHVLAKLGIVQEYTFWSLFGFNLGIELGQITIIAIVFLILYLLSKQKFYSQFLPKIIAICLIIISMYWFIERAFDVNLHALGWLKNFLNL